MVFPWVFPHQKNGFPMFNPIQWTEETKKNTYAPQEPFRGPSSGKTDSFNHLGNVSPCAAGAVTVFVLSAAQRMRQDAPVDHWVYHYPWIELSKHLLIRVYLCIHFVYIHISSHIHIIHVWMQWQTIFYLFYHPPGFKRIIPRMVIHLSEFQHSKGRSFKEQIHIYKYIK
jgi:hypothetical protein